MFKGLPASKAHCVPPDIRVGRRVSSESLGTLQGEPSDGTLVGNQSDGRPRLPSHSNKLPHALDAIARLATTGVAAVLGRSPLCHHRTKALAM